MNKIDIEREADVFYQVDAGEVMQRDERIEYDGWVKGAVWMDARCMDKLKYVLKQAVKKGDVISNVDGFVELIVDKMNRRS